MNVVAFSAAEFAASTRQASGVEPWTSPPWALPKVPPLAGADIIYVALHGQPWSVEWMGDDGVVALDCDAIAAMDLTGAVVFAEACWLPESPVLAALLGSGARAVIAGSGENAGGRAGLAGVSALGYVFRLLLERGAPIGLALTLAKAYAIARTPSGAADIAGFKVYQGRAS